MRAAPAVSVRCAGGVAWRGLRVVVPAAAAMSLALWGLGHAELHEGVWLLAAPAAALAAGLLAAWASREPAVDLVWDGAAWSVDGKAGALDVMLDLGSWMLLRLRPNPARPGGARWIPCTAAEAGARWQALRVAAYAPVPRPGTEVGDV